MLKLTKQRLLTSALLLPVVVWFVQKWFFQHDAQVVEVEFYRLGSLDSLSTVKSTPDTTAIILNWSRFPNVQRIASLLCSPPLDRNIAEVFVWNNSPQKIQYEDFIDTTCSRFQLRIYNSPANVYFQARFLACAQSSTAYCFIQDDDYLVIPEVILSLLAHIRRTTHPHTIHLLPPHEHLSSTLRQTYVSNKSSRASPLDNSPSIHTGFAWLGHGAITNRSDIVNFLELMHRLNVSEEEMKMADNYYTILSNRVPEIWFDQGVELGGGQPFTVGVEGDERNDRHVLQATKYLESIISTKSSSWLQNLSFVRTASEVPVDRDSFVRAACKGARCLLGSNIPLLPDNLQHETDSGTNILKLETYNRGLVSSTANQNYLDHSPNKAIDDRVETYFQSLGDAKMGEFIQLDFFDDLRTLHPMGQLEQVWLVDVDTERILRSSSIAICSTGLTQCTQARASKLVCKDAQINTSGSKLRECVAPFQSSDQPHGKIRGHVVRLEVVRSVEPPVPWRVYEVWVRGLRPPNVNDQPST